MQTQTLNISLPTELVKKVDQVAKKEYRNRSEFIRQAVRVYLSRTERWEKILELTLFPNLHRKTDMRK